jgi:hypothetical protein
MEQFAFQQWQFSENQTTSLTWQLAGNISISRLQKLLRVSTPGII